MGIKPIEILDQAVWAPSAENCQPWKFKILGNQINIYNIPEMDQQTWGQRASYFAHGALIENINIIADNFGYSSEIKLFPDDNDSNLVATVKLLENPNKPQDNPLFPYIKTRTTNRKPFESTPLTSEQALELEKIIKEFSCQFYLQTKKEEINKLAGAASSFEKILFRNKDSHAFFFNHITWDEKEDKEKSIGFFIKTLELPPPAKIIFPLIKNWSVMNLLNKINFSGAIAKENCKVYAACSAMGVIALPNNSKESFVLSGRLMQKVWLTATKMGLSIQPLAGIIYLMLDVLFSEQKKVTAEEVNLINESYKKIQTGFNLENNTLLALMFRIGKGEKPSAKSSRLPVKITTL